MWVGSFVPGYGADSDVPDSHQTGCPRLINLPKTFEFLFDNGLKCDILL